MAKINDTTTFPNTAPALGDHVPGTDVSNTTNDANGETVTFTWQAAMDLFEANMTVPSSVSSAYRTSTILASTSNAEGASLIGVEDSGLYWTATTVEGVLAEIGASTGALAALDDVGTAQIQADAVTPTELENTAVTPGSYTLASLTVDAQGRLTAASSGTTDWSATVDADIVAGGDGTINIGSETFRFGTVHTDAIDLNGTPLDGSSALAAPAGDRIMFYDLTAGGLAWLTVGTGLSISDTTITASASAPEGTAVLSTGPVTDGYVLTADGAGGAAWEAQAGGGDVSKVGTPVDGQIGVWTGDGTIEGDASLTFDTTDDTLVIAASGKLGFGAVDILSDSSGTTTLQNIDALDATTEATIEAAIDTLANLTSIQGNTVTLTGAFIRSGAHSLTLTTGATTNVTLPASGTLATLAGTETFTNKTLTDPKVSHSYNAQTGTTYTLVLADANKVVSMSNASANTLTIPTNASVAYPTGTIITVFALGAGTTTIAGDTGVTLSGNGGSGSAYSADIQTQYGAATLIKIGSDSWLISGDIDTVAA